MIIDYNDIKQSARQSLKGNWKIAILSTLVYTLINMLTEFLPESADAPSLMLSVISDALFTFGYTAIILHISRGERAVIFEIFNESKRFIKGLGMVLTVNIYTLLWTLLLIIPGIIASIRYSMTYYIWVDNPEIGIGHAIDKSIEMTRNHILDIFKLGLSFIGWIILAIAPGAILGYLDFENYIVIMSLGMIFVIPYIQVSLATLYDKLSQEKQINIEF